MSATKESREAFRQRMRPDHSKDACYQARQNSHKCLEENNYDQDACANRFLEYRECIKKDTADRKKKRAGVVS